MGAGASSDISKDQLREKYEEVNYEEVQNSVVEAQWHKTVSCFCFFLVEQCIFPYFIPRSLSISSLYIGQRQAHRRAAG